jgi:hypothetical protein
MFKGSRETVKTNSIRKHLVCAFTSTPVGAEISTKLLHTQKRCAIMFGFDGTLGRWMGLGLEQFESLIFHVQEPDDIFAIKKGNTLFMCVYIYIYIYLFFVAKVCDTMGR